MSFLVDKIIHNIPFDFHRKKYKTSQINKKKFVNRKKVIEIEGVSLSINLTEKDYD